jgi:hypothetical protein
VFSVAFSLGCVLFGDIPRAAVMCQHKYFRLLCYKTRNSPLARANVFVARMNFGIRLSLLERQVRHGNGSCTVAIVHISSATFTGKKATLYQPNIVSI